MVVKARSTGARKLWGDGSRMPTIREVPARRSRFAASHTDVTRGGAVVAEIAGSGLSRPGAGA